jgi:hypothetical protein
MVVPREVGQRWAEIARKRSSRDGSESSISWPKNRNACESEKWGGIPTVLRLSPTSEGNNSSPKLCPCNK